MFTMWHAFVFGVSIANFPTLCEFETVYDLEKSEKTLTVTKPTIT